MRQIKYNDASWVFRFDMPHDWYVEGITTVTLTINDLSNTAKLSATACTLYTATTLGAAATAGDATITLGAGATAVVPGDRLRIKASADGRFEDVEVANYNTSTRVATLTQDLRYSHTNGTSVYGLWCTITLNTSNTTTFDESDQCLLIWTPNNDDVPVRERAEIMAYLPSFSRLRERFAMLYPREYRIIENNFENYMKEAKEQLQTIVFSDGLRVLEVVDDEKVAPSLMSLARWLVVQSNGEKWRDEQDIALAEFNRNLAYLRNLETWQDDDQDNVKEVSEFDDHSQLCGSERGI